MRIVKVNDVAYPKNNVHSNKRIHIVQTQQGKDNLTFGNKVPIRKSFLAVLSSLLLSLAACTKKHPQNLPEILPQKFEKVIFEPNPPKNIVEKLLQNNYLSRIAKNSYSFDDENLAYFSIKFADNSSLALTKDNYQFGRVIKTNNGNKFSEILAVLIHNNKFSLLFGDGYKQEIELQKLIDIYKYIGNNGSKNVVIPVYLNTELATTTHNSDFEKLMKKMDKWAKPTYY